MKITQVNNSQVVNKNKYLTFKKGLTSTLKQKMYSADCFEMQKRLKANGLKLINFKNWTSVLASCLATTEIIKCFGLKLPQKFSFCPLESGVVGRYTYPDDIVQINSDRYEFKSLVSQDEFETSHLGTPITKHFLQTYMHEFIHAAHYQNLALYYSTGEIASIANVLKHYSPTKELVNPKVENQNWTMQDEIRNGSILGYNSHRDLIEFFADNAVFEVSRILEKNPLGENSGENLFFNPTKASKLTLSFQEDVKDNLWNRIFNKKTLDRRISKCRDMYL